MYNPAVLKIASKAADKYRSGDSLSDVEITVGINVLDTVCTVLAVLGERYQLAANDLRRIRDGLHNFELSRKRD